METQPLLVSRMKFDGSLLRKGFWIYVWEIRSAVGVHLYVGRTGDSSSPHAQSPFNRISHHLNIKENAKANSLYRQLKDKADCLNCSFEMVAIGPVFNEQDDWDRHKVVRDKMAALEGAIANELKNRGYSVLGNHPPAKNVDETLCDRVWEAIGSKFPLVAGKPPRVIPASPSRLMSPPPPDTQDLNSIWAFAYDFEHEAFQLYGIEDAKKVGSRVLQSHRTTGLWTGTTDDLRCALFVLQRHNHWRDNGSKVNGKTLATVLSLYEAIRDRWGENDPSVVVADMELRG